MKSLFVKSLIYLFLLILLDFLCGIVLDGVYTDLPQNNSLKSIVYRSFFSDQSSALVLGSSTASHHYNCALLKNELHSSVFNAGRDGHDIIYADLVLQAFLERTSLNYVVLDVGTWSLDGSWKNRNSIIRQYYGRSKAITSYFDRETNLCQTIKLKSNLYRYNETLFSTIGLLFAKHYEDTLQGFSPLYGRLDTISNRVVDGFIPDNNCLSHLENIVSQCNQKGIRLIIVVSPQELTNKDFNKWIWDFGNTHQVPVIMENENPYWYEHPEFFYDASHLNNKGAHELSSLVAGYFNRIN